MCLSTCWDIAAEVRTKAFLRRKRAVNPVNKDQSIRNWNLFMPKPSTNQPMKSGTKQDRRRERRGQQLRQAAAQRRAARLRWIVVGVVIAAAVLTVASFLYFTRGSTTGATTTQAAPIATSASTPVDTSSQQSLSPTVDNVQCNSSQQMTFTLGNFLHVWKQQFSQLQYPTQLDRTAGWQAYVNGKPYSGDFNAIPLNPHTLITLAYQSPGVKPDTIYSWNGL